VTIGPDFALVLGAAQAGDERALEELYRTFNPPLLRYLSASASYAADDLAQEVWLAAAPQLSTFAGDEDNFRAWLFTIGRRRLIDHWRTSGRRPTVPLTGHDTAALAEIYPSDRLETVAAIAELTAGLTAEQAEVLLLRVVAGLSVDEVAAIMGKRPGAIRVLQHRAVRRAAERHSDKAVTP
jgi:RNA polymerase sigma-70 factor (ECF subfamily)